jgi:hypothetical protein
MYLTRFSGQAESGKSTTLKSQYRKIKYAAANVEVLIAVAADFQMMFSPRKSASDGSLQHEDMPQSFEENKKR